MCVSRERYGRWNSEGGMGGMDAHELVVQDASDIAVYVNETSTI